MPTSTFAELGLSARVQAAIAAAGYTEPTPIQLQAIPVAVTGRDVLGIAQTGTGKTAGFVLPMLARLETGRARARMPRSLILAPTRELAAQVAQSFEKYGINHKLSVALLIGGVSFDDQLKKLDRGVDVLIATPGRMLDHFQRGKLLLTGVEILVIDEADRMLDMGFIPDIERICKLLPIRRQTLFFSATMPPEIQRLVNTFLKDPVRVEVARPATAAQTITQLFHYCPFSEDWEKRDVLRQLIRSERVKNAIIFCNRKRDVAILLKSLQKHGFNAGALHGDMDQMSRTATLDAFREGRITLLAASDVAARGLDIPDVSHIFNFDVPWQSDDYVHRIGRTGRAGKEGRSMTLVTPEEFKQLKDIERMLGAPVTWIGAAPTPEDMAGARKHRRGRPPAGHFAGRREGGRSGAARSDRGVGAANGHAPARRPGAGLNGEGQSTQDVRQPGVYRPRPARARLSEAPFGERLAHSHPTSGDHLDVAGTQQQGGARPRAAKPSERPRGTGSRGTGSRGTGSRDTKPRENAARQAGPRQAEPRQAEPRQAGPPDAGPRDAGPRDGKEARPQRAERSARQTQRREQHREDQAPATVGLGEHVPAFLRAHTRRAK